jgi:hypothetical protein
MTTEELNKASGADPKLGQIPETKVPEVKTPEKREILKLKIKESIQKSVLDLENMTEDQIKAEAKKWGHIPEEDFRGDKSRWRSAEDFLRDSTQRMPALQNQVRKRGRIIETQNKIIENQREQIKIQKMALQPKMKEAFENADYDAYNNLRRQESGLDKSDQDLEKLIEKPKFDMTSPEFLATPNVPDPELKRWLMKNPNYHTDQNFRNEADKTFDDYKAKFPNATSRQLLEAVDMKLKNSPSTYNPYSNSTTYKPSNMAHSSKTRSFDNLTEGSQRACREAESHGVNRADYLKNCKDLNFIWG